jgi:hypothetical protein
MEITKRDEKIYKFIEKHGFATVKQITNVFFNDILYGSTLAKRRLDCLIEHGYVKSDKSTNCEQNIFYSDDKFKKQTFHNILVMDIYTEFLKIDDLDVLNFERNKGFGNNKIYSDAFITVKYDSFDKTIIQSFIIEVETSNNNYRNTLSKYNDVDVYNDIVSLCDGYGAALVFVDPIKHSMDNIKCPWPVIQLNENLTNFPLIFASTD